MPNQVFSVFVPTPKGVTGLGFEAAREDHCNIQDARRSRMPRDFNKVHPLHFEMCAI